MPVPTHRDDCSTRLYATSCPDCNKYVYFFSCSCGSRVFFDLNRPPWTPHEDRCIPYLIRYLRDVKKLSSTSIRQIIEEYSRLHNVQIPPDIHRRIIAQENKDTGRVTILEVLPHDEGARAVGIIESVNLQVNFFKRMNYTNSAIGRALLGKMVEQSYVEIVLREDPDEETRFSNRFTFYLPLRDWQESGLRPKSIAIINLVRHTMPNGRNIWLATEIDHAKRVAKATKHTSG